MARCATIERNTKETKIRLTLELDGTGKADIHTGIGFFDHMLNGFARHGLFDLKIWRSIPITPLRTSALYWERPSRRRLEIRRALSVTAP